MMVRIWRNPEMLFIPKKVTRVILNHSIRRKLTLKERGPRVEAMKPPTPRLVTRLARLYVCTTVTSARTCHVTVSGGEGG